MNIEYKIRKYKLKPEWPEQIGITLPDQFLMVKAFLNNTIYNKEMGEWVLQAIDKVLSGKSDYEERDGESFGIKIKKDTTTAYDMIAEDKGETRESTIPTQDLRELVEIWTKAIDEFHKSKHLNKD